jgi:RNA polymerase sigma-70 factor (ECF subfamily)
VLQYGSIARDNRMSGEHNEQELLLAEQAATENTRLVVAIGNGSPEAEREFAVRFMPRVRAMLTARSRNSDFAPDLLQDVMIESICALRRGQLREPAKLTPFVLAIARNMLNNHFRGTARQPESLEFPDNLPDLTSIENKFETEQRSAQAMNAIASLDRVDRAILQLTLVEGLKPGVIAEKLGLSPDVVRQRKLRATRRVVEFVSGRSQNEFSNHSIAGKKT